MSPAGCRGECVDDGKTLAMLSWGGAGRGRGRAQEPTEMRYSPSFSVTVAACSGTTGSSYTHTIRAETENIFSIYKIFLCKIYSKRTSLFVRRNVFEALSRKQIFKTLS